VYFKAPVTNIEVSENQFMFFLAETNVFLLCVLERSTLEVRGCGSGRNLLDIIMRTDRSCIHNARNITFCNSCSEALIRNAQKLYQICT
jgi:hypothetical protein